ncbi:uncharacterized protein LOC119097559 [Pollicipes pollicipes]|uniref:uncharacterized protein LOC119097559 n=1 Tax=Pollicipes pollicipes TaxID=41117 RepID=UPI0018855937|nr:uncharacterized protein LOC119097559 [Pollicipes pollicipes]
MEMRRGSSPLSSGPLFKLAASPTGYLAAPGLLTTVAGRAALIKQEPMVGSPEPGLPRRPGPEEWLPSPNQTSLDSTSPFGAPPGGQTGAGFSVSPMSSSSYDPYSPTGKQGEGSRHISTSSVASIEGEPLGMLRAVRHVSAQNMAARVVVLQAPMPSDSGMAARC